MRKILNLVKYSTRQDCKLGWAMVGEHSFSYFCGGWLLSRFQVYRIFTSIIFHGSVLHVLFNMMALVPLGSELERIMGSVRMLYIIFLLAISNALFHLTIALLVAYNPIHSYPFLMNECAIGFSGILFSMIVIETSLSGHQSRSVFGLFNVCMDLAGSVPSVFMTNVSLLGHLCGILSGFAYTYGLFNFLIPGPSFYSTIEASSLLSSCVRRPKFILCTGGNPSAFIPTYSSQGTASSGFSAGSIWRNLSSWIPQRETSAQSAQDGHMFPGRGRTLGSGRNTASDANSESNLQVRLLDNSNSENPSDMAVIGTGQQLSDGRRSTLNNTAVAAAEVPVHHQDYVVSEEEIQKLVSMGFERTQVEVALAAADGDLNVAVEILSQQG
ncbi:rhomboid-like protein 15 [Prunus yedoensis var. nudiflora]|uniref:Rhomboid-like protein 15 n=1 Tax=Prunus yedoensis var. nudiflora TaxID=2094558 RepID=A0A314ZV23_PRUYE|nr:rhomboid-like protein 15 [Prunus yedoensis var. nudiflora]